MKIEVRVRDLMLNEKDRDLIERRVHTALARHAHHIAHARVMVRDINGPRGGADKCCSIQVIGMKAWNVNITDTANDTLEVVDKAVDRAVTAVSRSVTRARENQKNKMKTTASRFLRLQVPVLT